MKKKLTNYKKYPPKCEYCAKGRLSPNGENILCSKKGIMQLDNCCSAYKYDILKRIPKKPPIIKSADPDDFKI